MTLRLNDFVFVDCQESRFDPYPCSIYKGTVRNKYGVPRIEEKRPGDPTVLVASSEKIKRELRWKPKFPELDNRKCLKMAC